MTAPRTKQTLPAITILLVKLDKFGMRKLEPIAAGLTAALRRQSNPRSLRRLPAMPPADMLGRNATRFGDSPDIQRQLRIISRFLPALARRLRTIVKKLLAVDERITNAVGAEFLREQMERFADPASRALTRTRYDGVLHGIAGRAAEATIVNNRTFVAMALREVDEVGAIAQDPSQLARLGLRGLDPTPLLFTDVRTAARKGSTEARQLFVDAAILFKGKGLNDETRYLVKVRLQSKLDNVSSLLPGLLEGGEFEIGQLVKDELRFTRGAWHFHRVRVAKDAIIDHPGITRRFTVGTRTMTVEEKERLRFLAGISVEHIVHDTPHEGFYRWARALLTALGVVRPGG